MGPEHTFWTVEEMISPESHKLLFLTSPMISVLFIPVGWFPNSFFEAAESREKADLQAVALIYKYWKRN